MAAADIEVLEIITICFTTIPTHLHNPRIYRCHKVLILACYLIQTSRYKFLIPSKTNLIINIYKGPAHGVHLLLLFLFLFLHLFLLLILHSLQFLPVVFLITHNLRLVAGKHVVSDHATEVLGTL